MDEPEATGAERPHDGLLKRTLLVAGAFAVVLGGGVAFGAIVVAGDEETVPSGATRPTAARPTCSAEGPNDPSQATAPLVGDSMQQPTSSLPSTAGPPVVDFAVVSQKLENEFPESFGGLVNLRDGRIAILAVRRGEALRAAASAELGPPYTVIIRCAVDTLKEIRALKAQIESDSDSFAEEDVTIDGVGIHIDETTGPRAFVVLHPDTPQNRALVSQRYEDHPLIFLPGPQVDLTT